ncbi:MAG: hypothetical protein HYS12_05100 [Planctomycetes bacterium]|nr:hypothetical protein [Planctomycetota bacterium]
MRKWTWATLLVLPLVVAGGLVYAKTVGQGDKPPPVNGEGYVCPITGEELPCPLCCPLNQNK